MQEILQKVNIRGLEFSFLNLVFGYLDSESSSE